MARVGRGFFEAKSPYVARRVLGKLLVRVADGKRLSGTIVETEAYRGSEDPASHAYMGRTKRNAAMFGEPGHAYVYFSYGANFCLNLTCERAGTPAAVLVRALEPREGMDEMKRNRSTDAVRDLTSGPGKLTQAMGIDLDFNGEDLVTSDRLFLEDGEGPKAVATSTRVGISRGTGLEWRYFAAGNQFVSKSAPSRPGTHNYRRLRRNQEGSSASLV